MHTSKTYPYKITVAQWIEDNISSPASRMYTYGYNNFLKETWEEIEESGHMPEDIDFIGKAYTKEVCTWDEFKKLADFVHYSGYGSHEVCLNLTIQFKDGSKLVRWEYDGSEGWSYSPTYSYPENPEPMESVKTDDDMYL